jgi:hypothetical protein
MAAMRHSGPLQNSRGERRASHPGSCIFRTSEQACLLAPDASETEQDPPFLTGLYILTTVIAGGVVVAVFLLV